MDFHFITARKHDHPVGYAIGAAFDTAGLDHLVGVYNEITKDSSFGTEHAELLFASVDGEALNVRHTHTFPHPSDANRAAKNRKLQLALDKRGKLDSANRAVDAAKGQLSDAKKTVGSLTDEDKDLLAEYDLRAESAHKQAEDRKGQDAAKFAKEQERLRESHAAQQQAAKESATAATANVQGATVSPAFLEAARDRSAKRKAFIDAGSKSGKSAKELGAEFDAQNPGPSLSQDVLDSADREKFIAEYVEKAQAKDPKTDAKAAAADAAGIWDSEHSTPAK